MFSTFVCVFCLTRNYIKVNGLNPGVSVVCVV